MSTHAARRDGDAPDGLVIIDKPAGWTSHDVVARVRRITGVRRVGHAGTLDPSATGVLVVGIGRGTRVIEYLEAADKSYRAAVRLGITTDTDDADGAAIAELDWRALTADQVRVALGRFEGDIEQVPPAYSAIKREGVPLYRLARSGAAVQPPPRRVTIHAIRDVSIDLPHVSFEVDCSKGTYVRALARDLGRALGCGGHLAALRRLRVGAFALDSAVTLETLADRWASGDGERLVLPLDVALRERPALIVGPDGDVRLRTGRAIASGRAPAGALARVYGADGAFLATARGDGHVWRPEKVFAAADA
jgi:tRNA pseudouridine55 synthase